MLFEKKLTTELKLVKQIILCLIIGKKNEGVDLYSKMSSGYNNSY